jgi:hypothetical protein
MRCRTYIGVLAVLPLVAVAQVPPGGQPPAGEPASLAARIDLTRITVLGADYARAVRDKDTAAIGTCEGELAAMLRDEVLPYAPRGSADGERSGGGAAAPGKGQPASSSVDAGAWNDAGAAGDGAGRDDARVAAMARAFLALEGKGDDASLKEKLSIVGTLQSMCDRAYAPASTLNRKQTQEERARARKEMNNQADAEKLSGK